MHWLDIHRHVLELIQEDPSQAWETLRALAVAWVSAHHQAKPSQVTPPSPPPAADVCRWSLHCASCLWKNTPTTGIRLFTTLLIIRKFKDRHTLSWWPSLSFIMWWRVCWAQRTTSFISFLLFITTIDTAMNTNTNKQRSSNTTRGAELRSDFQNLFLQRCYVDFNTYLQWSISTTTCNKAYHYTAHCEWATAHTSMPDPSQCRMIGIMKLTQTKSSQVGRIKRTAWCY